MHWNIMHKSCIFMRSSLIAWFEMRRCRALAPNPPARHAPPSMRCTDRRMVQAGSRLLRPGTLHRRSRMLKGDQANKMLSLYGHRKSSMVFATRYSAFTCTHDGVYVNKPYLAWWILQGGSKAKANRFAFGESFNGIELWCDRFGSLRSD